MSAAPTLSGVVTSGPPSGSAGGDLAGSYPNPVVKSTMVPTAVKTSAYTAAAGDFVPVDASGGTVAIALPSAPADKTRIGIKIVAQAGTPNAVTINRGGSDVFNKASGSTSLTLTSLFQGLILQYQASTGIWYVQSTDSPLSSVFGRTGVVAATSGDYAVAQVTGAAPLASPALTGAPTAPTQSALDNSTKVATTAYTDAAAALKMANPMTTAQDLIIGGTSGAPARLPVGTTGQQLLVRSDGTVVYSTPAKISLKAWGAVIDGATDDSTAVQAALDASAATGFSVMHPGGTCIAKGLQIDSGATIEGGGWNCVIKAPNSANTDIFVLKTANSVGFRIANLVIDGNRTNQTSGGGINFNWTGNTRGSTDPLFLACTIDNVYVRFTKGDGVAFTNTTNGMNPVLNNVQVVRCDGNGFNIQCSDGQYVDCATEKTGLAGWVIGPTAAASHLTNCIGSDAGQITTASGHGFKFNSGRCTVVGCFAQDNTVHGFYLAGSGASDNVFSGCTADSNSFGNGAANAAGFYVDTGTLRTTITGCTSVDRQGGGATQAYGYYLNGTSDFTRIAGSGGNGNVLALFLNNSSGTSNEFVGKSVPANAQSGTTYTFTPSDMGKVVESTGGSAATFTIPTAASGLIPVGAMIEVFQYGAGQVTIAGAGGVTLRSDGAKVHTAAQYATIALRQRAADEWVLSGDLS